MSRTNKQIERQKEQYRNNGKYAKVNPCYVCNKSAGVDYYSHHDTDNTIDDELLVLCKSCAEKLNKFDGKTAVQMAKVFNILYAIEKEYLEDTRKTVVAHGLYTVSRIKRLVEELE